MGRTSSALDAAACGWQRYTSGILEPQA